MSADRYRVIQGEIINKEEGQRRFDIDRDYILDGDAFIKKSKIIKVSEPIPSAIVASRDPADEKDLFMKWVSTNSGFIQEFTNSGTEEGGSDRTTFSDIQSYLMDCQHQFVFVDKTRQFGFSYVLAARALAEAMISLRHTTIFVSFNEDESKEKIVYARELYDSLPLKYKIQRKLKYDNKTSLVFEKSGKNGAETRILSYPQRIIRGKGGGVKVRIDEAAHIMHFRTIYTSALPVLSRGDSSLWVGSSPAGKAGLFYEIKSNQDNNYALFVKIHIHWWDVPVFCKDVDLARKTAPDMMTDDRVQTFATDRLKAIRRSMIIEDFQQEYECAYNDESYSYFPLSTIMKCVPVSSATPSDEIDFDSPAADLS